MAMIYEFVEYLQKDTNNKKLKRWINKKFDEFKELRYTTKYKIKCKKCGNILIEGYNYWIRIKNKHMELIKNDRIIYFIDIGYIF